jgi:dTDP-4-amino-4,6-dideoxygalactose transaminase
MFEIVDNFEKIIAEYFGSPYCVAVDSCTHGIELCLRLKPPTCVLKIPTRTYISIPFTLMKLDIPWTWISENWQDYYYLHGTNIIDAAVLWKNNSYIPNTMMCLSFQNKKHLPLGRGGAILLDNIDDFNFLKSMSYDGRKLNDNTPWYNQDISSIGYHYYMTPEMASDGIKKFNSVKDKPAKKWSYIDYPNLPDMSVFK